MSFPNVEIYQVEKHMETAISTVLDGLCPSIYKSRQKRDLQSSRIELKAILGENVEHRKIFAATGGFTVKIENVANLNYKSMLIKDNAEVIGITFYIDELYETPSALPPIGAGMSVSFAETSSPAAIAQAIATAYGTRNGVTASSSGAYLTFTPSGFTMEASSTGNTGFTSYHDDVPREAFDAWTGALEITVSTNRSDDADVDNHSMMLGAIRARLTNRYLATHFSHPIIAITDIRDSGTLDSFVDENDIDISVLSFYTLVNIKPSAWLE